MRESIPCGGRHLNTHPSHRCDGTLSSSMRADECEQPLQCLLRRAQRAEHDRLLDFHSAATTDADADACAANFPCTAAILVYTATLVRGPDGSAGLSAHLDQQLPGPHARADREDRPEWQR